MTDPVSGNGHRPELPRPGTGRRRSMLILGLLLLGLPVAFLIRSLTDEGWRQITTVDVLRERDVIYVPDARTFLVDGDPPAALSARSPHLGELLVYCESAQMFLSLEHGESFDRMGRYIDGPAERGMDRFAARVRNRYVEINVQEKTDGFSREHSGRPTGPFCYPATPVRPGFVEHDPPD